MSDFYETGPSKPVTESSRVDKVSPTARRVHNLRALIVVALAIFMLIPILVMVQTAFKTLPDVYSVPPKVVFEPTFEGFVFLFTERAIAPPRKITELQEAAETGELGLADSIALQSGQQITGLSDYAGRLCVFDDTLIRNFFYYPHALLPEHVAKNADNFEAPVRPPFHAPHAAFFNTHLDEPGCCFFICRSPCNGATQPVDIRLIVTLNCLHG